MCNHRNVYSEKSKSWHLTAQTTSSRIWTTPIATSQVQRSLGRLKIFCLILTLLDHLLIGFTGLRQFIVPETQMRSLNPTVYQQR
jgi:hypothetical protein